MRSLASYNAANLDQLLDRITRNSIGMDGYFDRIVNNLHETTQNYPPYNLVRESESQVPPRSRPSRFYKGRGQCIYRIMQTLRRGAERGQRDRNRLYPQRTSAEEFHKSMDSIR